MGWTGGALDVPFTSLAAIAFELGDEFASRVIDTARYGTVIYAAVRSEDGAEVFGLVLLAERNGGILYTKAISEDMGPAEDCCPERILDLLSEPNDEWAREWRRRCRARIERGRPSRGQTVVFKKPLSFVDGTEHRALTFVSGSRFRSRDGALYHVPSWWTLDYELRAEEAEQPSAGDTLTPEERRRVEEADERGDYGSLASRIGRLADARDATAQGLEELRRRPGARGSDIWAREEQLRSYDRELAELRERAAMNVVLSYGLGGDSTALLLRWLEEPSSRDFDLGDLLVVTSMTGDEWPRTGVLVQEHILPRLRAAGVRFAQVARAGARQAEGIAVLDDTDAPERLHLAGTYKLSDELAAAGTIPQTGGNRRCSMKFKGWVIDTYLARHAPQATRHAFGFEAGEVARAERCAKHMPGRLVFGFESGEAARARRATDYDTPHRVAEFPLIEWGWDREDCQHYIEQVTDVPDWPKSACVYCPFALTSRAGRWRTLRRYDTRPESALETLMLERRALCLNPRGGLIAGERLADLIAIHRPAIDAAFKRRLDQAPHAVYEVRRLWRPRADDPLKVANTNRDLRVLSTGTRSECEALLRDRSDGIERVYVLRRRESLPAREHFLVAGPAGAADKAMPNFDAWWNEIAQEQIALAMTP